MSSVVADATKSMLMLIGLSDFRHLTGSSVGVHGHNDLTMDLSQKLQFRDFLTATQ